MRLQRVGGLLYHRLVLIRANHLTSGWLAVVEVVASGCRQRRAVQSPWKPQSDESLLRLLTEFDLRHTRDCIQIQPDRTPSWHARTLRSTTSGERSTSLLRAPTMHIIDGYRVNRLQVDLFHRVHVGKCTQKCKHSH